MQMVVYIVNPLFDLFWVAVKTYLPLIIRGTLLFLVAYLLSTCFNLVQPVSLLPTVIVYSLWPYDRILSEGELFLAGTTMHQM